MKRVLYIDVSSFYGGAQASFEQLRRDAAVNECQLTIAGSHELRPEIYIATHHYRANLFGLLSLFVDAKKCKGIITDAIADFRPDCIYLNTMRSALLLLAERIFPSCEIILHDRDVRCPCLLPRIVNHFLHPQVIAISSRVADKWSFLDKENLRIQPNLFDIEKIASTKAADLPFSSSDFVVILPADFTSWKNHRLLIDAVAIAVERCPNIRCLLKGRTHTPQDQHYLSCLRQRIQKKKLERRVIINDDDTTALPFIAAADCLVACSKNEPFGRTLVEALALGKCIAATFSSAAPEIIEGCAAVKLANYTPASLANALCYWASAEKRESIKASAQQRALVFLRQSGGLPLRTGTRAGTG